MAPHEMTRNTRGLHSGEPTENAAMNDFRFKGHPTGREAATRNLATSDPTSVTPGRCGQCLVSPEAAVQVSWSLIDPAHDRRRVSSGSFTIWKPLP